MRKVATPDTGKATTPRQEGGSSTWHKEGGNSTWHEEGGNSTWHEEGGNSTWHDEEGNSPWRRQLHMTWMTYNSTWHQSMKPHGTKEAAALHGKRRCNLRPRQNATPHKQDTDSTWCRGAEHKSTHTQRRQNPQQQEQNKNMTTSLEETECKSLQQLFCTVSASLYIYSCW